MASKDKLARRSFKEEKEYLSRETPTRFKIASGFVPNMRGKCTGVDGVMEA